MTTSNEHNNAPAVPQGEQATIAGLDAANGHLSTLLDDSVLMLKQLRQMVDDLHERWSNGGKPERGEFELLDRVDDWLSCRPDSIVTAPAPAQGEPFGHFRAEPFGWTECAEDDEGAIALYERPQEVGLTDEERADMACAVAAICTGTSSRTVAATAIELTERALRAKGGK